jgi:tRNA 2-selenouridine synthase SelU
MFYFLLREIRMTATLERLKGEAYVLCSVVTECSRVFKTESY